MTNDVVVTQADRERAEQWRSTMCPDSEEPNTFIEAQLASLAEDFARHRVEALAAREGWQPIATAPKDGTDIFVISHRWLCPVPAYYVSSVYLAEEYGDALYMEEGWYPSLKFLFDMPEATLEPTHWRPLPVGPSA